MSNDSTTRSDERQPGEPWSTTAHSRAEPGLRSHLALNPTMLAYLMAPIALLVILLLMHAGVVERVSAWLWVAVFIATVSSAATRSP